MSKLTEEQKIIARLVKGLGFMRECLFCKSDEIDCHTDGCAYITALQYNNKRIDDARSEYFKNLRKRIKR